MSRLKNAVLPGVLILGLTAMLAPTTARAGVITFAGTNGPIGPGSPTTEGIFTYDTLSGSLFRDSDGNPGNDMEGNSSAGGGVLRIVRSDLAGGLFTFDASDIRFESNTASPITF